MHAVAIVDDSALAGAALMPGALTLVNGGTAPTSPPASPLAPILPASPQVSAAPTSRRRSPLVPAAPFARVCTGR